MKKDRNSFFESSNFNMSTMSSPNMPMNAPMNMMGGMPQMNAASNSFYASNNMPMPTPLPNYPNMANSTLTELESRIAKIERNINRLDARLSKLEGNSFQTPYDSDGNMYMV